jgi:hypothetical protein
MAKGRWQAHKYKLRAPKSGHKHWRLLYARKKADGTYGEFEKPWPLKQGVPPWIFKHLLKKIKSLGEDIPSDEKTYHKCYPEIVQTLIANGKAQGFTAEETNPKKHYCDVVWYIDDKPFIAFMVADLSEHKQIWGNFKAAELLRNKKKSGEGHRFRQLERHAKAPVRLVWSVSCQGKWFRLGIGKMRTK